jgi:hypothetical protein
MSSGPKKCAHKICTCLVPDDKKFCSQLCEDSEGTEIACDCKHEGCGGNL